MEENKNKVYKILYILLIILSVYVAVKIYSEIRKDNLLGQSDVPATISFSGHGEVQAVPDIANIYFTIRKVSKTAKEAQEGVASIEKKALDFLKTKNVDDKDIKTENASVYPKYEYESGGVASYSYPNSRRVLIGYEASESITVKVRNVDDAGTIMQGLGTTGVSDLNGPNFAIDNEDGLKAQARKEAIDDAKEKAKVLAKDLGVKLVKITSFSEGGNYPMMYGVSAMAKDSASAESAPAQLPKGENTISSDVTITYEIR